MINEELINQRKKEISELTSQIDKSGINYNLPMGSWVSYKESKISDREDFHCGIEEPDDVELINATELIETIKYMCDDGTEEEQRWGEWFKRVIQAQINREKARRLKESAEESRVGALYDKVLDAIRNYAKSKEEDNGIHET